MVPNDFDWKMFNALLSARQKAEASFRFDIAKAIDGALRLSLGHSQKSIERDFSTSLRFYWVRKEFPGVLGNN